MPPLRSNFQSIPDPINGDYNLAPFRKERFDGKDNLLWLFLHEVDPNENEIFGVLNLVRELERLISRGYVTRETHNFDRRRDLSELGLAAKIRIQLSAYRPFVYGSYAEDLILDQGNLLRAKWFEEIEAPMRCLTKYFRLDAPSGQRIRLGDEGDIHDGQFNYPVGKRPTKESIEAMQCAERNLSRFWKTFEDELIKNARRDAFWVNQAMIPRGRDVERTTNWNGPTVPPRVSRIYSLKNSGRFDNVSDLALCWSHSRFVNSRPPRINLLQYNTRKTGSMAIKLC